jgi:hypothetical protein
MEAGRNSMTQPSCGKRVSLLTVRKAELSAKGFRVGLGPANGISFGGSGEHGWLFAPYERFPLANLKARPNIRRERAAIERGHITMRQLARL